MATLGGTAQAALTAISIVAGSVTDIDGNGIAANPTFGSFSVDPPLVVGSGLIPVGTVNNSYSVTLTVTGGSGTGYEFTNPSGLPAGLSMDIDGNITGTPTSATGSPFSFTALVTDSHDGATTLTYTISVNPAITILPTTLPGFTVGNAYVHTLTATGGSGSGYHDYTATGLPDWLSLSSNGELTGTPPNATPASFSVTVTDGNGATTTQEFTVSVNPPITFTPATLPVFTVGDLYDHSFVATGGTGSGYVYTSENLPSWLTLTANGELSGTPTTTTGATFTIIVTDSDSAIGSQVYTITVNPAITVNLSNLPNPIYGGTYSQQLVATGGSGAGYTYAATGLPPGLSLSPSGLLSGVPTTTVGSPFTLVVTVTDGINATGSQTYLMTVNAASSETVVTSSATSVQSNQPVTLTASVSPQFTGIPSGEVNFYSGSTLLGTAALDGTGTATFSTSNLSFGANVITAVFVGDGNFLTSTSPPLTVSVTQSQSNAGNLTSSKPQTFYGEDVTLTATFSATSNNGAPMTGTVQFYDGTTYLGTVPLQSGASPNFAVPFTAETAHGFATLPTTALTVGSHVITAIYSGDANYSAATSQTPVTIAVAPATTSTALAAVTTPQATTLTATVVVTSPGNPPIVGSVAFFDGTTLLGTEPVTNGVATLSLSSLAPGVHSFKAVFSGGGTSSASGSTVVIASTDGPQIVGLTRYGYHSNPTTLLLNFDSALDAARAQDPANYQILDSRGRRVAISGIVYNATTHTVTIATTHQLNIHQTYTLTVIGTGATGVANTNDVLLDGAGTGQPGSNFTAKVTYSALGVPGGSPAILYVNGQPQSHPGSFQKYVSAIVRATKSKLHAVIQNAVANDGTTRNHPAKKAATKAGHQVKPRNPKR